MRAPTLNNSAALNLDSVHSVETAFSQDAAMVCASPLCCKPFQPGGMAISPRRYCSAQCRQVASVIKRAAELLKPLGKDRAWNVLKDAK